MKHEAFIFDLNGTMIDDMEYHITAWRHILNDDLGAGLSREEVKKQMYGKNGDVLERIFGAGRFTQAETDRISINKEQQYQQAYLPHLRLIAGLGDFIGQAHDFRIPMAIGSAAIHFNINFVFDNLHLRHYFKAVVSAEDVVHSKPDAETYIKAAALMHVEPASCIVFEDAPKGVEAAYNAGMPCIVLTTMHEKTDFAQYPNVLHFMEDYTDTYCKELLLGMQKVAG